MKKLSLQEFKAKSNIANSSDYLEKISGGILGACHCKRTMTIYYGNGGSDVYTSYYQTN